ncbi:MAG: PIG-L family deacetylase, partial [Candidatus Bathyarchaeia archaeon]
MKFRRDTAEFYVPDGRPFDEALRRTTHMGICAHQDDLEIMAIHGILECFMADGRGFLGVTV